MSFYILDTDHLSLFQRRHPKVVSKILTIPLSERAITITSVEEQLRGRLSQIRKARKPEKYIIATGALHTAVRFFASVRILDFTEEAQAQFDALKKANIRVGSQDLRIAAISLSLSATLVTRNHTDFEKVPGLQLEDWSV